MEPFNVEFDDVVDSLAGQIATQARTIAMLEGQVAALARQLQLAEDGVPDADIGTDQPR